MLEPEKCGSSSRKWRTVGTPTTDEILPDMMNGETFIYTHTNTFSRGSSESTLNERYLLLNVRIIGLFKYGPLLNV